jgi:hypothetical protein
MRKISKFRRIFLLPIAAMFAVSPQAAAYRVVDRDGKSLGDTVDGVNAVYRTENGALVKLRVSVDSVYHSFGVPGFWYESADCSGARLLYAKELIRSTSGYAVGGMGAVTTIYYPANPVENKELRSREHVDGATAPESCQLQGGTPTSGGGCCFTESDAFPVGPAATLDIAEFHPPFHAE